MLEEDTQVVPNLLNMVWLVVQGEFQVEALGVYQAGYQVVYQGQEDIPLQ